MEEAINRDIHGSNVSESHEATEANDTGTQRVAGDTVYDPKDLAEDSWTDTDESTSSCEDDWPDLS